MTIEADERDLARFGRELVALSDAVNSAKARDGKKSLGARMIRAERERQLEKYDVGHDDGHPPIDFMTAANCYVLAATGAPLNGASISWPWRPEEFRPRSNKVQNLVVAGALIAAAIDRCLRALEPRTAP